MIGSMYTLCRSIVIVVVALFLPMTTAAEDRRVDLAKGEQRVFTVPGLMRVSIGGGGIADVRATGASQFILYGQKEGRTSLLVFRRGREAESWEIRVHSEAVERFRTSCRDLLGPDGCSDLKVAQAAGKVVLSGRIGDLEVYHRVRKLKKAFPELVLMVDVEPLVHDALVVAINEEFARAGLKTVKVSRVGAKVFLEGTVADDLEKRKVEAIVEAMYDAALGSD